MGSKSSAMESPILTRKDESLLYIYIYILFFCLDFQGMVTEAKGRVPILYLFGVICGVIGCFIWYCIYSL